MVLQPIDILYIK